MKKFLINHSLNQDSLNNPQNLPWQNFIANNHQFSANIENEVNNIINQVLSNQDQALINLTNKFDHTNAQNIADLIITNDQIQQSHLTLSDTLKSAIDQAYQRIYSFHQKQLPQDNIFEDECKTTLGNIWKAIDHVGVYVPGGTASYPSSLLMSVIPALVSGVKKISLFVPSPNSYVNPAILYCAKLCNINKIYQIGGAQAIAAMAYGTQTITKVDKIVGPGNSYVNYAKKRLYGIVGIDMIAGPTDVTIICDASANANWIAIDALSQLEHGVDSKAFIVCDDENFADEIVANIKKNLAQLSRHEIIKKSLENSAIFIIKNLEESSIIANLIAPEHLQICVDKPANIVKKINNAGAIFVGNYTPEAIGDYVAGPSHTLPTSGNARFSSGLSVYDFLKRISYIACSPQSFEKIRNCAATLAQSEGLDAHKLSIDIRQ